MGNDASSLLNHLRREADALREETDVLVPSSEREFLDLGGSLQDFWAKSSELTDLARECAAAASGEAVDRTITDLRRELDRLTGLCNLEVSSESLKQLDRIVGVVSGLDTVLGEFKRIIRKLQMLGISTRIESARLGAAGRGFSTLSDDVEKLGLTIVDHSARIRERSGVLLSHLGQARERTVLIRESQERCSAEIFAAVRGNLDELTRLSERSHRLVAELPERVAAISRGLGDIVQSLQFHDIVRQQLEHVAQAFADVENEIGGAPSDIDEDEAVRLASFSSDMAEVQLSQVTNARERFDEAVESIRRNLRDVAGEVEGLVADLASVASGGEGGQSLARVGSGIAQVMEGIRQFTAQGQGMAETMRDVAATVQDMAAFVVEIEEVGSEIELIALNASIKAAHTGEEGAALGVLAMAIQTLSVEAREQTEKVSGILGTISEVSARLQENAATYMPSEEVRELLAELTGLTDSIGRESARESEMLGRLSAIGDRLGGEMREKAEVIEFHVPVISGLDAVMERIGEMTARIRREVPHVDQGRQPERLRELLARYTMEAERDIYRRTFGESPGQEGDDDVFPDLWGDETETPAPADDGLGDNVELF